MKVVVIGGTGLIGSRLVTMLRRRGQEVVAASPACGVDTLTGEGLPADIHARYFGAELNDESLVPGSNSRIAPTRFKAWLSRTFPGLTSDQHERPSSVQGQQA